MSKDWFGSRTSTVNITADGNRVPAAEQRVDRHRAFTGRKAPRWRNCRIAFKIGLGELVLDHLLDSLAIKTSFGTGGTRNDSHHNAGEEWQKALHAKTARHSTHR